MSYVEIVRWSEDEQEDEVIKRMGPHDARKAERIAMGAEINLNHERFFVRVVEE